MPMKEFFEDFEVVRGNDKMEDVTELDDEHHPGYGKQVVRERKESVLVQFPQWVFSDSAVFGSDTLKMKPGSANSQVEKHCMTLLMLFVPFRKLDDLKIEGSFHRKFIQLFGRRGLPIEISQMMENIQMFHNSTKLPGPHDPLCGGTIPFAGPRCDQDCDDDEDTEINDAFFDGMFDFMSGTHTKNNRGNEITLTEIRTEGARACGFHNLPPANPQTLSTPNNFVREEPPQPNAESKSRKRKLQEEKETPDLMKLMELVWRKSQRRITTTNNDTATQTEVDANGTALSLIKWSEKPELTLDFEQKLAFQTIAAACALTHCNKATITQGARFQDNETFRTGSLRGAFRREKKLLQKMAQLSGPNETLRMFLDGPGGAGKSRVIEQVVEHIKQFTENLDMTFGMRTIVVTAMSGVAATSIGGETLHSAVGLNKKNRLVEGEWENARSLIIDEVSFMSTKNVEKLDMNLRQLTGNHTKLYGGIHVVFCGDFCQLEPCKGVPLHSQNHLHTMWQDSMNAHIELMGLHRCKNDLEWGHILHRMRNGELTHDDINKINKRVINGPQDTPQGVAYCVHANADRTAINAGVFSKVLEAHCKTSDEVPQHLLLIEASDMQRVEKSKKKTPLNKGDIFHTLNTCGDNRVREGTSEKTGNFVDPLLKLRHKAPLMLVKNEDVPNGHANGTRVFLESVVLKEGASISHVSVDGRKVRSAKACDINHIECSLDGKPSKIFKVKPRTLTCRVKAPLPKTLAMGTKTSITFKTEMTQLNVLSNDATTGHKLQGQTKKALVISTWSNRRNWNYVALSRVKTRDGLFLVKPLSHSHDFSVHEDLQTMLPNMRQNKQLSPKQWDIEAMEAESQRELNALQQNQ